VFSEAFQSQAYPDMALLDACGHHVVPFKFFRMGGSLRFAEHLDNCTELEGLRARIAQSGSEVNPLFTKGRCYVPGMTFQTFCAMGLALSPHHFLVLQGDKEQIKAALGPFNMQGRKRPRVWPVTPTELLVLTLPFQTRSLSVATLVVFADAAKQMCNKDGDDDDGIVCLHQMDTKRATSDWSWRMRSSFVTVRNVFYNHPRG